MPLRNFTSRQIDTGLVFANLVTIVLLVFLIAYSVGRWRKSDEYVAINAANIRGLQEALREIGVQPASVPDPVPPLLPPTKGR